MIIARTFCRLMVMQTCSAFVWILSYDRLLYLSLVRVCVPVPVHIPIDICIGI